MKAGQDLCGGLGGYDLAIGRGPGERGRSSPTNPFCDLPGIIFQPDCASDLAVAVS